MTRGMYEEFFNFRTKPFELVPNPDFLYLSKTHKKALTHLDYGIREKAGFILLTGEVGSGKTTLIRDFIKRLDGKVTLSKVFNTKVNSEQLISMINDDFGLDIKGKDKVLLLKELYDFLIDQYAKGYHCVLIIDEAQNLTTELLEEIRMLSNLETDRSKLLQIILAGQPELKKILALPELRQLRQRISISCHLLPLTKKETEEYIFHRLEIAGNRDAVKFADGTIDIIHSFSRGIPRLVNIVCDFLLLSAYVEETKELTADLVKEVIDDIEMETGYWQDETDAQPTDKDLIDRLDRLEKEVSMLKVDYARKEEISRRLFELEKMFIKCINKNQTDFIKAGIRLRHELKIIKAISAELGKEVRQMLEKRKSGFTEENSRLSVVVQKDIR
jgi:putative secretion ATPase (PEP-CTERM system associated)